MKWFVGYSIYAQGPDHSTLERFEDWASRTVPRAFFDQVLEQIDQAYPEERQLPQIGDTYALRAKAARATLIELIRDICAKMLKALEIADKERLALVKSAIDEVALFGPPDESSEGRLKASERTVRLEQVVLAAQVCETQVTAALIHPTPLDEATRQIINTWLDHLGKVLADNVLITVTPAPSPPAPPIPETLSANEPAATLTNEPTSQVIIDQPSEEKVSSAAQIETVQPHVDEPVQSASDTISVTELSKDKKGSFRLGSTTDVDATYRVHANDGSKTDFGYNVSVLVSKHFIREIQVATGAQPDPVGLPDLMRAQIEHHDLIPPKVIYDAAAGEGPFGSLLI